MIFLSELTIDWGLSLIIIMAIWWILLYLEFALGKNERDVGKYFRLIFDNYRKTELRLPWKVSILSIEYILAMFTLLVIKSAWYPAQWTRWTIYKILFNDTKRKERERLEKLADK